MLRAVNVGISAEAMAAHRSNASEDRAGGKAARRDRRAAEIMQRCADIEDKINRLSPPEGEYRGSPDQHYGHISYSQHGEDMVFMALFRRLGIWSPSFLDIGANDPLELSNTALLRSMLRLEGGQHRRQSGGHRALQARAARGPKCQCRGCWEAWQADILSLSSDTRTEHVFKVPVREGHS